MRSALFSHISVLDLIDVLLWFLCIVYEFRDVKQIWLQTISVTEISLVSVHNSVFNLILHLKERLCLFVLTQSRAFLGLGEV